MTIPVRVGPGRSGLLADLKEWPAYDLVVGALGYEARARRIPLELQSAAGKHAIALGSEGFGDYDRNAKALEDAGFDARPRSVHEVAEWVREMLQEPGTETLRCAFDISSLSRDHIAALLEGVGTAHPVRDLEIDILYAPAAWMPAPEDPLITEVLGPVSPYFAGWSGGPDRPVVAIVGLGYEPYRAVGALEYLEPESVWAFMPVGTDGRYDSATALANETLLRNLHSSHVLSYEIADPFDCYAQLERVTYGVSRSSRPVLVPLGPKLFACCCLLVGLQHRPAASVWRVTPGSFADKQNRDAEGHVVGLRLNISSEA